MRSIPALLLLTVSCLAQADCSRIYDNIKVLGLGNGDDYDSNPVTAGMVPRSPYVTSVYAQIQNLDDMPHTLIDVASKKSSDDNTVKPQSGQFTVAMQNRGYQGGAAITPQTVGQVVIPANSVAVWRPEGPNNIKLYAGSPYEGGNEFVPSQNVVLKPLKITFTFQDNGGQKCAITVDKVQVQPIMLQTVNPVTVF